MDQHFPVGTKVRVKNEDGYLVDGVVVEHPAYSSGNRPNDFGESEARVCVRGTAQESASRGEGPDADAIVDVAKRSQVVAYPVAPDVRYYDYMDVIVISQEKY